MFIRIKNAVICPICGRQVNGWFSAQISICPGPGRKMLIDWVLVLTIVGSGSSYNVLPVFCYLQTQWASGYHCFCLCSVCNLGTSKQYLNALSDQLKSIFMDGRRNKFHDSQGLYYIRDATQKYIFLFWQLHYMPLLTKFIRS